MDYLYNMKTHFEYPSGVTQADIGAFLRERGITGTWYDQELNIFELDHAWTMEEFTKMSELCRNGFVINHHPVRGFIMVPPPAKLCRLDSVA